MREMNEKLTAMYVKASILTKRAKEKVVETVKDVFTDETGDVNVVAIVVLIGVAVLLAIVFKEQIAKILKSLFEKIDTNAGDAVDNKPQIGD